MKIKTHKLSALFIGLMVLLMVTSCNSSKKMAETEKANIQTSLTNCQSELSSSKSDLTNCITEAAKTKKNLDEVNAELKSLKDAVNAEKIKIQKMKAELTAAFADYSKDAIRIDERDGRLIVVMQNSILYPSGKVTINPEGLTAIQTISQVFKNNKGLNILVESHTDKHPISTTAFKDNWDLSVARSVSVVRLLEKYGVNPTRMTAAGRGEFVPVSQVAPNNAETDAKNRRTEFIIAPKMQGLYKLLNDL